MTTYAVDRWAALGDPTRRSIFARLAAAPMPVGELADALPVSRPAVSQHLKVLRAAGLLTVRQAGARRIYGVDRSGLDELRAELDTYWNDALTAYKQVVERLDDTTDRPDDQPTKEQP